MGNPEDMTDEEWEQCVSRLVEPPSAILFSTIYKVEQWTDEAGTIHITGALKDGD